MAGAGKKPGAGDRLAGMSDGSMKSGVTFVGRLVPEPPSMACDVCAAIISPGTGPGAPHSDARKWDSAPFPATPRFIRLPSHTSFLCPPPAQRWDVRTQLIKVSLRKRLASGRGERARWRGQGEGEKGMRRVGGRRGR